MNKVGVALVFLLAVSAGYFVFSGCSSKKGFSTEELEVFNRWRKEFGKLYSTPSESQYRMKVLIDNHHLVNKMNSDYNEALLKAGRPPLKGPMFGLMPWSDTEVQEFLKVRTGLASNLDEHIKGSSSLESFSRDEGSMDPAASLGQLPSLPATPFQYRVRDQGNCGSCWAFSALATVEKHMWKHYGGQFVDLSHQQLVDCDKTRGINNGCSGGFPGFAIEHIKEKGIAMAAMYPYIGVEGRACMIDPRYQITIPNTKYQIVMFNIKKVISGLKEYGLTFSISVSCGAPFMMLKNPSEPFDISIGDPWGCVTGTNHAVNAVDAGVDIVNGKSKPWIKIQNSWGTTWGNGGFAKVYTCGEDKLWGQPDIIVWADENVNFSFA